MTKKSRLLMQLASLPVVLCLSAVASAQENGPAIRVTNNGTSGIYRHASTLEEGFFRGIADLGRSIGDYNYNTSLAYINLEEAKRRSIQNRLAAVENLYEIKRLNREYKTYNRRIVTREQAEAISKARMPQGLTDQDYDREVGRLFWPSLLSQPDFEAERNRINGLVSAGGLKKPEVRELAVQMEERLLAMVDVAEPVYYIPAKKFLESLKAEAISN